jgi:23S rRNA pseudouridine1911/1915/1917 synthase
VYAVPDARAGERLDRVLRSLFGGTSWNALRRAIDAGKVSVDGTITRDGAMGVPRGGRIGVRLQAPRQRSHVGDELIVWCDAQLVVARKPAGISSVPYRDLEKDNLADTLREVLARRGGRRAPLGVVHRLDKETSGLLVYARTVAAKLHLKQQFRVHSVERCYLALAAGAVRSQSLRSRLVKDRGDGKRGSTRHPKLGQPAVTHVTVRERFAEATLIECRLETGRTHQIRIHLSEAGHPLLGERVYLQPAAAGPAAPRVMLHAAVLGFTHPTSGEDLSFHEPPPRDFSSLVEALRHSGGGAPSR